MTGITLEWLGSIITRWTRGKGYHPILTFSDAPALGAGEPAIVTTAPAIANAIFDATGVRCAR